MLESPKHRRRWTCVRVVGMGYPRQGASSLGSTGPPLLTLKGLRTVEPPEEISRYLFHVTDLL